MFGSVPSHEKNAALSNASPKNWPGLTAPPLRGQRTVFEGPCHLLQAARDPVNLLISWIEPEPGSI